MKDTTITLTHDQLLWVNHLIAKHQLKDMAGKDDAILMPLRIKLEGAIASAQPKPVPAQPEKIDWSQVGWVNPDNSFDPLIR
jgi:hypothetical protein